MRHGLPTKWCVTVPAALFLLSVLSFGTDEVVAFDSGRWQLGPTSRIEEFLGRKALTLTGDAVIKDAELENGIVEVDLAAKEGTVFPTIIFRRQDGENYEEFYVRPHKSGQPDALQYSPVFNGLSAWQLYYGEGCTSACTLPHNEWIHVRLEISGTQARAFVGDAGRPALEINELKRGTAKGGLGLKVTGPIGLAYFSDFKYRVDDGLKFEPPIQAGTPFGTLMDWELSQSFAYNLVDIKIYPSQDLLAKVRWQKVTCEPSGLVNVARHAKKGPVVPGVVLARTRIQSDEERPMELQFGYSDLVGIFLNGRILFTGSNLFQSRDPFFQGRVGLFDSVFLPLKKGSNELLLLLAEAMGGWGFMGRAGDAVYLDQSLTKLWEVPHRFSWPETVLYDQSRNVLYVSNFNSDGAQFISKVKLNGEIETYEWITGLARPAGMALFKDKLYIVERTNLVEVQLPSGQIVNRHAIPGPGFLNDTAVDSEGNIYVSDGQKAQILKFSGGQFSTWKSGGEFAQVNGLHYSGGKLYAGVSSDASLKAIDLESGEIRTFARLDPGAIVDGIETDEEGNLLVSDFNGKIFLLSLKGQKSLLLDSTAPKHYCANFAYVPAKKLLVIPSLSDNRVVAYQRSTK